MKSKTICKKHSITPILIFIPELNQVGASNSNLEKIKQYASELEMDLIDLTGVYDNEDILSLNKNRSTTANHPNAKGHKVIADKLYKELIEYFQLSQ